VIVTLTTDFGLSDGYVGAMKGVLLSMAPQAVIVDICHTVPAGDILGAGFLLYQATPVFSPDSIHVAVVDPGVGSERRALAVSTGWGTYVAPDNGLLTLVLSVAELKEMVSLTDPTYWRPQVSATFHGRDIFAPVAAHLANGLAISRLGCPVTDPIRLPVPVPEHRSPDAVVAHVLHVDHFGNLILDVQVDRLPQRPVFEVAGHTIGGLSRTYADGAPGGLMAYVGSTCDHVEIGLPGGHAARFSGAVVGTPVLIQGEGT
jgi:S-adenosylmethionine hydrolase